MRDQSQEQAAGRGAIEQRQLQIRAAIMIVAEHRGVKPIRISGECHIAEPDQTAIEAQDGAVVLHYLESGAKHIGAKLMRKIGLSEIK